MKNSPGPLKRPAPRGMPPDPSERCIRGMASRLRNGDARQARVGERRRRIDATDLRNAPHFPPPRLQIVHGQAPAHRLTRQLFMFGQSDHRSGQQIQRPALASLRRAGAGGGNKQRCLLADRLRVAPRRASSLSVFTRGCLAQSAAWLGSSVDPLTGRLLVITSSLTPASTASRRECFCWN